MAAQVVLLLVEPVIRLGGTKVLGHSYLSQLLIFASLTSSYANFLQRDSLSSLPMS